MRTRWRAGTAGVISLTQGVSSPIRSRFLVLFGDGLGEVLSRHKDARAVVAMLPGAGPAGRKVDLPTDPQSGELLVHTMIVQVQPVRH